MPRSSSPKDELLSMKGDTPVPAGVQKRTVEPGRDRPVQDITTLSNLDEFTLYTLAPVYWMVGVPFDLTQEFTASQTDPVKSLKLGVPRRIINVPGWESVVEAIETRVFDKFADFLGQCVFQKSGQMSSVCGDYVEMPYALSGHNRIAVFTPRGLLFRFSPGVDPAGNIVLCQTTPDGKGKLGDVTDKVMEGLRYAGGH